MSGINTPVLHRRHVFKDLQPYVCTFAECTTPNKMFPTRREWFAHELKFHRKEWYCNDCNSAFTTEKGILDHLRQNHPDACNALLLPIVLNGCSRVPKLDQQCSLCARTFPANKIRNHVSRHLQQLALYALPRRDDLEVSGDGLDGEGSNLKTRSVDSEAGSQDLTNSQGGIYNVVGQESQGQSQKVEGINMDASNDGWEAGATWLQQGIKENEARLQQEAEETGVQQDPRLHRGAVNSRANLLSQYASKLQQNWIPQGWQKDVTVSQRMNYISQM